MKQMTNRKSGDGEFSFLQRWWFVSNKHIERWFNKI